MISIGLIITIVFTVALALCASTVFVIKFSHPDDDGPLSPRIVVTVVLAISIITILGVTVDVTNKHIANQNDRINMEVYWIIFLLLAMVCALAVLPFVMFFGVPAEENLAKKLCCGFTAALVPTLLYIIPLAILYTQANKLTPTLQTNQPTNQPNQPNQPTVPPQIVVVGKLSFFEYAVALLTLVGWVPFSVFAGVGLVALPLDLFFAWKHRPNSMVVESYDRTRTAVGMRARRLRQTGEKIMKQMSANKLARSERKLKNQFEQAVHLLMDDYQKLQVCYHLKGGNPIWPWVKLGLSILCTIVALLWIIQIMAVAISDSDPSYDILGIVLNALIFDTFALLSIILFGGCMLALSWACMVGLCKVGAYIPFVTAMYPLQLRNTYTDAFLVNGTVILAGSFPAIHLATAMLPKFTEGTYIYNLYDRASHTDLFHPFFTNHVFQWIMVAFSSVTILALWCFPANNARQLEEQLHDIAASEEGETAGGDPDGWQVSGDQES